MARTRLTSLRLSASGTFTGSFRQKTSAARSCRRRVTSNRIFTPVMVELRVQMPVPVSIRYCWKSFTLSGFAVSGERSSQAAKTLAGPQVAGLRRWTQIARRDIRDHARAEGCRRCRVLIGHGKTLCQPRQNHLGQQHTPDLENRETNTASGRHRPRRAPIPRTTFYRWYDRYLQRGEVGLQDKSPKPNHVWNRVPIEVKRKVVDLALKETELSPRELAVTFTDQERYFVSESTVYRTLKAHDLITSPAFIVLKAADEFQHKTTAINQLWQTDFTYIKVLGWGWFYLSTVLDDYSRYLISWKLCTNMRAEDVTDTLDLALQASGCDQVHVVHKPRLLSDNGFSYVSGDLAEWLQDKGMKHSRGAPYHPQTQGKIERWHQTLKNRILLENYFLPGDLEAQIEAFVDHYNHQRYHESLNNVTPADVYFGRDQAILEQREKIKQKTFEARPLHHRQRAA